MNNDLIEQELLTRMKKADQRTEPLRNTASRQHFEGIEQQIQTLMLDLLCGHISIVKGNKDKWTIPDYHQNLHTLLYLSKLHQIDLNAPITLPHFKRPLQLGMLIADESVRRRLLIEVYCNQTNPFEKFKTNQLKAINAVLGDILEIPSPEYPKSFTQWLSEPTLERRKTISKSGHKCNDYTKAKGKLSYLNLERLMGDEALVLNISGGDHIALVQFQIDNSIFLPSSLCPNNATLKHWRTQQLGALAAIINSGRKDEQIILPFIRRFLFDNFSFTFESARMQPLQAEWIDSPEFDTVLDSYIRHERNPFPALSYEIATRLYGDALTNDDTRIADLIIEKLDQIKPKWRTNKSTVAQLESLYNQHIKGNVFTAFNSDNRDLAHHESYARLGFVMSYYALTTELLSSVDPGDMDDFVQNRLLKPIVQPNQLNAPQNEEEDVDYPNLPLTQSIHLNTAFAVYVLACENLHTRMHSIGTFSSSSLLSPQVSSIEEYTNQIFNHPGYLKVLQSHLKKANQHLAKETPQIMRLFQDMALYNPEYLPTLFADLMISGKETPNQVRDFMQILKSQGHQLTDPYNEELSLLDAMMQTLESDSYKRTAHYLRAVQREYQSLNNQHSLAKDATSTVQSVRDVSL